MVADGINGTQVDAVHSALLRQGAVPRLIGVRLGRVETAEGAEIDVEVTFENMPAVLFDALVVPGGKAAVEMLGTVGQVGEFIVQQYRHCKPILVLAGAATLVENAGAPLVLADGSPDPGIVCAHEENTEQATASFVAALAAHRHFEREADPPSV